MKLKFRARPETDEQLIECLRRLVASYDGSTRLRRSFAFLQVAVLVGWTILFAYIVERIRDSLEPAGWLGLGGGLVLGLIFGSTLGFQFMHAMHSLLFDEYRKERLLLKLHDELEALRGDE